MTTLQCESRLGGPCLKNCIHLTDLSWLRTGKSLYPVQGEARHRGPLVPKALVAGKDGADPALLGY